MATASPNRSSRAPSGEVSRCRAATTASDEGWACLSALALTGELFAKPPQQTTNAARAAWPRVKRRGARVMSASDFCELAFPVVLQPLEIAAMSVEQSCSLLGFEDSRHLGLEQDFSLRDFRLVHPTHLGDLGFLLVGHGALGDAFCGVLLAEPLHRQLVRTLRGLIRHTGALWI